MKKNVHKKRGVLVYILIALGMVLSFTAQHFSALIEAGYSQSLYRWLIQPLSRATGIFPFSLAEFIVVFVVLLSMYKFIMAVPRLLKKPKKILSSCLKGAPRLALALVMVYVAFNMVWGLNYNRLSFSQISGLDVAPASVDELEELALILAERANSLREQVDEDGRGVMVLPQGVWEMLARADTGYYSAAELYPELSGKFGKPKGVLLSRYWSYTGIGGVYFPFTAEANVNIDLPHFMLPSTATHEMAHQRGFAREDEANYIAYLTSIMHPDPDFQYSGTMLALIHTMNALARHDLDAYKEVRSKYSPGVHRDLQEWKEYWQRYEGPVEQVSNKINDSYLKVNRQEDGVHSYGRMVDLLLADFRQRRKMH